MESKSDLEHLSFKEIEIDGDIQSFCSKLETVGFIFDDYFDDRHNIALLKGSFAARDNCDICVYNSEYINKIWKVVIFLPICQDWFSLKADYLYFKKIYSKKYGVPESFEFFMHPYFDGDGKEIKAIENGKFGYSSFWTVPTGTISLLISEFKQINIGYEDKINSNLKISAENEIAEMDI